MKVIEQLGRRDMKLLTGQWVTHGSLVSCPLDNNKETQALPLDFCCCLMKKSVYRVNYVKIECLKMCEHRLTLIRF